MVWGFISGIIRERPTEDGERRDYDQRPGYGSEQGRDVERLNVHQMKCRKSLGLKMRMGRVVMNPPKLVMSNIGEAGVLCVDLYISLESDQ